MSKNLNRRFFYDFLLELAKEYEANPNVIEEGPDHFINVDEPDGGSEIPTSPEQGIFWLPSENLLDTTDLGSLIGNFDSGYSTVEQSLWF